MAQLQAILNYQQVDAKLYKIEQELSGSKERKEYAKVKKFLEAAPEKLDALEAKAKSYRAVAEELAKKYEQLEETLKEFDHIDELVTEGADVSFYKKKAQSLVEKIKKIKMELTALVAAVKETDEEYKKLKEQVLGAEKMWAKVKAAYSDLKAQVEEKKAPLKAELAGLVGEVPAEMLEIYNTKRKEKIFPVVGKVVGNRCPYCSMDLSISARGKLAGGGWIECETHSCSRILFE